MARGIDLRIAKVGAADGWNYAKLEFLARTDFDQFDRHELEYLEVWLATTPKAEVIARMKEWEARTPKRAETEERRRVLSADTPPPAAKYLHGRNLRPGDLRPD